MTALEAIHRLEEMQSQIIDGPRTFGDIADVIRSLIAKQQPRSDPPLAPITTAHVTFGRVHDAD